jgi:hypothetical protein
MKLGEIKLFFKWSLSSVLSISYGLRLGQIESSDFATSEIAVVLTPLFDKSSEVGEVLPLILLRELTLAINTWKLNRKFGK